MIETEENCTLTIINVVILKVKTESGGSTKGEQSLNGTSLWNIFTTYAIIVVVRIESNIVTHSTVLVKTVFPNFILNRFTTVQNLKNAKNVRKKRKDGNFIVSQYIFMNVYFKKIKKNHFGAE